MSLKHPKVRPSPIRRRFLAKEIMRDNKPFMTSDEYPKHEYPTQHPVVEPAPETAVETNCEKLADDGLNCPQCGGKANRNPEGEVWCKNPPCDWGTQVFDEEVANNTHSKSLGLECPDCKCQCLTSNGTSIKCLGKCGKSYSVKDMSWLNNNSGGALVKPPQQGKPLSVKRNKLSWLGNKVISPPRIKSIQWLGKAEAALAAAPQNPTPGQGNSQHPVGKPFQGPSGRWFVRKVMGDGKVRVVPSKNQNKVDETKPASKPKAKKETAPKIKKEKLTIDQAEQRVKEVIGKDKVGVEDLDTLSTTLMGLTVKDLNLLKDKLGITEKIKTNVLKPERVSKIVSEALKQAGVTAGEDKPVEAETTPEPQAETTEPVSEPTPELKPTPQPLDEQVETETAPEPEVEEVTERSLETLQKERDELARKAPEGIPTTPDKIDAAIEQMRSVLAVSSGARKERVEGYLAATEAIKAKDDEIAKLNGGGESTSDASKGPSAKQATDAVVSAFEGNSKDPKKAAWDAFNKLPKDQQQAFMEKFDLSKGDIGSGRIEDLMSSEIMRRDLGEDTPESEETEDPATNRSEVDNMMDKLKDRKKPRDTGGETSGTSQPPSKEPEWNEDKLKQALLRGDVRNIPDDVLDEYPEVGNRIREMRADFGSEDGGESGGMTRNTPVEEGEAAEPTPRVEPRKPTKEPEKPKADESKKPSETSSFADLSKQASEDPAFRGTQLESVARKLGRAKTTEQQMEALQSVDTSTLDAIRRGGDFVNIGKIPNNEYMRKIPLLYDKLKQYLDDPHASEGGKAEARRRFVHGMDSYAERIKTEVIPALRQMADAGIKPKEGSQTIDPVAAADFYERYGLPIFESLKRENVGDISSPDKGSHKEPTTNTPKPEESKPSGGEPTPKPANKTPGIMGELDSFLAPLKPEEREVLKDKLIQAQSQDDDTLKRRIEAINQEYKKPRGGSDALNRERGVLKQILMERREANTGKSLPKKSIKELRDKYRRKQ